MKSSGKSGHCTSIKQCNTRLPRINSSDYTICGYDCCNEMICCPNSDYGIHKISGQCNFILNEFSFSIIFLII